MDAANKACLFSIFLIVLGCNSNDLSDSRSKLNEINNNPCPPEWVATGKQLKQVKVNDSTEQFFLNDTLWFEMIGSSKYKENRYLSYLRLYRVNGLLEREGNAIYFDHPVDNYEEHGEWKFYGCDGAFVETKKFVEGQLVNSN